MPAKTITKRQLHNNATEKELWRGHAEFYDFDIKKLLPVITITIILVLFILFFVLINKNFLAYIILIPLAFIGFMDILNSILIEKIKTKKYEYLITNKRICILKNNKQMDNILFSELKDILLTLNEGNKTATIVFTKIEKKRFEKNYTVFLNISDYAKVYNLCKQIKG